MGSQAESAREASRNVSNIAAAVAGYWAVSLSMVFANKTLLGGADLKTAPMFITWFQCVVTVLFCRVAPAVGIAHVPPFEVKRDILRQVAPLSIVFTLMIVFNNLTLKYVEVSFYQVARSLTIVFNVVLDFAILGQRTSPAAVLCCAVVVSGFVLGNQQEVRWSFAGVAFGVTSSLFVAMNAIYVKKKFALVDNNPWKITLYNNLNATFMFLPLIVVSGELPTVLSSPLVRTVDFWLLMCVGGLLGVGISFATAAQIKYTSPLTHNVSATAKAAAQTVIALVVYRNPITALGAMSVAVVLGGSLSYTLVRRSEMRRKASEAEAEAPADGGDAGKPLVANSAPVGGSRGLRSA
jgi:solute carrier family 35 (GDP-fucose transporter), member C1